jgi:hypothetical protein
MKIGPFVLDTDYMTCDAVNDEIKQLKAIRTRRADGDDLIRRLNSLIEDAYDKGFDFCCRNTGEVLLPKYWVLYDNREMHEHPSDLYQGES